MVSFAMQKLLSLNFIPLFLNFVSLASGDRWKENTAKIYVEEYLPILFFRSLMVSNFTF